jgi:hypothetical protein
MFDGAELPSYSPRTAPVRRRSATSMKSLIPAVSLVSLLALAGVSACDSSASQPPGIEVSHEQLKPGGVYIAYIVGCEKGCDQLAKGDLILEVDGKPVTSGKDMRTSRIATGAPLKLKVVKRSGETKEVEIVAQPQELPPLKDIPPFWTVGAADLDKAPDWARRNLFAHASPMTMLVNAEGGITDGRQLLGKKRLIMFWDYATREEQAQAANMMQILQLAQDDLKAAGVEVMFTQIRFPGNDNGDHPPPGADERHRAARVPEEVRRPEQGPPSDVPLPQRDRVQRRTRARPRGLDDLHPVPPRLPGDHPPRRGWHRPLALRGRPDGHRPRLPRQGRPVHDRPGHQVRQEHVTRRLAAWPGH